MTAVQRTTEAALPTSTKAEEDMRKHLEAHNPALAKLADKAAKIISQSSRLLLEHSFQLGELFVQADSNKQKYGDNAFEQMCAAVGWTRETAWRTIQLIRCFPEKQRQSFLTRKNKQGKYITYSHLREIMLLPQETVRNELIEKFYLRGMSSAEARQESIRRRQARGRSPNPTSLAGGFVQINTMAKVLHDKLCDDLETRLIQRLDQLEAPDQKTKQAAIASVHQLEELGGAVQMRAAQMRQLLLDKGWVGASGDQVSEAAPGQEVEELGATNGQAEVSVPVPVPVPVPGSATVPTPVPTPVPGSATVPTAPPPTVPRPPSARPPRRSAAAQPRTAAAAARTSRPH